jgi:hypothetical protein
VVLLAGAVTLLSIIASAIGIRTAWPTLNASSLEPLSSKRARVEIHVGGLIPIHNIEAICQGNKIVFDNRHTLITNGFIKIDQYAVPTVNSGETFTLECPVAWSLHMNAREGIFSFGDLRQDHPPAVIEFTTNDGNVILKHPDGLPQSRWFDATTYVEHPVSGIDASLLVSYRLPTWLFGWTVHKTFHLIAQSRNDKLVWRIAPASEPTIPDGIDGMIIESHGNALRLTATGNFSGRSR